MARKIILTSGSVFNGNPITFQVQPNVITGTDSNKNTTYPSFHRVIMEVTCGMSGGNYEVIKMSAPVEKEETSESNVVQIDISSALRTFRDSYEYSAQPTTYPLVKFYLKAYDEYMLDGVVKTMGEIIYPAKANDNDEQPVYCTIFGGYSDFDRLMSNGSKETTILSRKPISDPHLAFVGEQIAYTPPYTTAQTLLASGNLAQPESKVVTIVSEGLQTIGEQVIYALPSTEADTRQVFRFINSFGVLESISVPRVYSKKLAVTTNRYVLSRQETFSSFSRASIKKQNNKESWLFQTDPLTEEWLEWYLHEFLMSEHIWIDINSRFIPCTISPEEETTFLTRTEQNAMTILFTAQLDINGSPLI